MKKLTALFAVLLTASTALQAQETVTGTVVDKKGTPLPGVRLDIPGTPDFIISDLDGTFSFTPQGGKKGKLTASYAGFGDKKQKIKNGMVVKMSDSSWRTAPDKRDFFVNLMLAVPDVDPFTPAYGLMYGQVKKWGWYVKGVTNTFGIDAYDYFDGEKGYQRYPYGWVEKFRRTYWSLTGGAMLRLGSPFHLYLGAGYVSHGYYAKTVKDEWWEYYDDYECYSSLAVDLGLMWRIKKFTITVGTTFAPHNVWCSGCEEDHFEVRCAGNFGIGYTF